MIRIFLIAFLILGCAKKDMPQEKIPSWYLAPPKPDKRFVYVSGVGIDKKEALLDALNNFLSSLNIKISSTLEVKKENFYGGLYNKETTYKIKTSVVGVDISDYEIIKAKRESFDKFFVLVKIDKIKLAHNLTERLKERFLIYKKEFEFIKKENKLTQFLKLKNLIRKLNREKEIIYIIKKLNPQFNEKRYIDFIDEVYGYYLFVKNTLRVEVVSSNMDLELAIREYLSLAGIKLGKSELVVEVSYKKREEINYNLIKYTVIVTLKERNKIISTNTFKVIIPPNSSLKDNFYNEIKELNLKQFFKLGE